MASLINLPGYNPGNALSFAGINQAIDSNRQNALAQQQIGMQKEKLGMERQRFDTEQQQVMAQRVGGMAQMGLAEKDPMRRQAILDRIISMHPDKTKLGPEYLSPDTAFPMLLQEAQGFQSQQQLAQTGLVQAQTEKARAEAAKAQREAAEGASGFGREIKPYQTPDGKIWGVQAAANGGRMMHDLSNPNSQPIYIPAGRPMPQGREVSPQGGQSQPQGWSPSVQPSGQPAASGPGGPLTPFRGATRVGDEMIDNGTGRTVRNVGDALSRGKQVEVEGKELGELRSALPKQRLKMRLFDDKSDRAMSTIDKAVEIIGPTTAGYGALLQQLPASQARLLDGYIKTVKANITFEELQAMRESSPTGGALGQVSNFENELLASVRAALDQLQRGEDLRGNLMTIKDSMAKIRRIKADAFAEDESRAYGEAPITGIRESRGVNGPVSGPRVERQFNDRLPPSGGPAPGVQGMIPPAAVQYLRGNPTPQVIQQFEAKYGQGSSRQFMGAQ